jgi:regulator of CtrA degradation
MSEVAALRLATVAFGDKLADSKAFLALFREGMALVEDVASYLDGNGREDAKALSRGHAISYASESMRLTTRLMQLASWLLLQRAFNDGEMSASQAKAEKAKVRIAASGADTPDDILAELPETLRDFILKAQRLQQRVLHLDKLLVADKLEISAAPSPLNDHFKRLQNAFGG